VFIYSIVSSLAEILQRQTVWRGGAATAGLPGAPTGFAVLDAELPGGGWPAGGLVEVLCHSEGVGELQIVLPALAALTSAGRRIAWLAPPHLPYAPALRAAGVRLDCLTVVHAPGRRDALWAAEQALRAGTFHALLLWLPSASYAELRRLAVAAQAGPGFALAFRRPEASRESSPAVLRLGLEPALQPEGGGLTVRILKRRGMPLAAPVPIQVARPVTSRTTHALGRAPLSAIPAPGAVARACGT